MNKKILLLASGFRYSNNDGINLGDVAQQSNGLRLIRETIHNADVIACANSINESCDLDNVSFSKKIITYLNKPFNSNIWYTLLPKSIIAVYASILLVFNCKRFSKQKKTLFLNSSGKDALAELSTIDAVFASGAGNFNDNYIKGVGTFWSVIITCAKHLGIPSILYGQQIGPLNTFLGRNITKWGLGNATSVGVREPVSFSIAKKLGLNNVILTGDGGWNLPQSTAEDIKKFEVENNIPDKFIAAQIRFDKGNNWKDHLVPFSKVIDDISTHLNLPIVFIPMYYATNDGDVIAIEQLKKHMINQSMTIDVANDVHLAKSIFRNANLAIGVSNHFCVFAASMGIPTIGISESKYMNQKLSGLSALWPNISNFYAADLHNKGEIISSALNLMGKNELGIDPVPSQAVSLEETIKTLKSILE